MVDDEQFDGLGVLRSEEHGVPIDASGFLRDSDGMDGPFSGASELAMRVMTSPRLAQCFVRQLFRFTMGTGEIERDRATLDDLSRSFSKDSRITDMLLRMVETRAFSERWVE